MNKDKLTTGLGAGTALAMASQIDFTKKGWWAQALVAVGVAALGYFTNKD